MADEVGEQQATLAPRQRRAGHAIRGADDHPAAEPDLPRDFPSHQAAEAIAPPTFLQGPAKPVAALSRCVCGTVGAVNAPTPGTELVGGYRLGPPVAQGAMGSIYEATDPEGYRVAAKRLLDERHAARFEIEGRLLSRLHHPRVVEVHSMVDDASGRYLIMEWVEGEDLAHVLRRRGQPGAAGGRRHPLRARGRRGARATSTSSRRSTATSSRRTSCSRPTAASCSSTSASPATSPPRA